MLLVSQDKTKVYNLDRITSLSVEEMSYEYYLVADNKIIGKFENKTIALAVLKEILSEYEADAKIYRLP